MRRDMLLGVIDTYKKTQSNARKDVDKQIEIFSDNCLWLGFADSRILSGASVQRADGKQVTVPGYNK